MSHNVKQEFPGGILIEPLAVSVEPFLLPEEAIKRAGNVDYSPLT